VLLVAVPGQHRPIDLGQATIQPIQVRGDRFFGIASFPYHDAAFNISDREKTIVDCLDRFDLCGGVDEVSRTLARLLQEADQRRLLDYALRMGNHALTQRLGLILERLPPHLTVTPALLEGLERQASPYVYLLDPHGAGEGPVNRRWRVRENLTLYEDL
jgi:predicted transcriptional regulator of viral defense system